MFLGVALYLGQLLYFIIYSVLQCSAGIYSISPFYQLLFTAAAAPLMVALLLLLILILGRTLPEVCSAILPSPGLEVTTAPLANQQLSLLDRTCLTRPSQDSVAASLSLVRMLIRSLDKVLRQTGHIHPDCPGPPIAVLQPPATWVDKAYGYW